MPDKWEYPWYAAWDLAFHCVALAIVGRRFRQGAAAAHDSANGTCTPTASYRLTNGLSATSIRRCMRGRRWRVYKIETKRQRRGDREFLERIFQKLLLNFTWWVNRKDAEGNNVFQGGFLGLDNIGVFDRSAAAADRRTSRAVRRHQLDGACTA